MSLFEDQNVTGGLHLATYTDSTKRTVYNWNTASYSLVINIINMTPEDTIFFAQELAEYRANCNDANAVYIKRGSGIKVGTNKYIVTNEPKPSKLFTDTYMLRLRKADD